MPRSQGSLNSKVCACHDRNEAGEYEHRGQIPKAELFRGEITRGSTQSEREEDRQPVEGLTTSINNGVDGQRLLNQVPHREDQCEHNGKYEGSRLQGNPELVCQVVGDQGADNTKENNGEPVNGWDVFAHLKLKEQNNGKQRAHNERCSGQPKMKRCIQIIRCSLTYRSTEDLDDPEINGDFRDLVEHLPGLE